MQGSCKTAAVYACAARHQYRVIEINAASVRNGRQVLQRFTEATQSHHLSASMLGGEVATNQGTLNPAENDTTLILFEEIDVHWYVIFYLKEK